MNEFEVCKEAAKSHDIVFLFSKDAEYLSIWAKDNDHLAFAPKDLIGKKVKDVIPGMAGLGLNKFIEDVYKSGNETPITYSIDTALGLQWFKGLARTVKVNNQKCILFTTNNISEIKASNQAIDDQNKQFASILESIPGAVMRAMYDYKTQVFSLPFISDKAKTLFKLEKYTPQYLMSLLSDEDRETLVRAINKAMVTQRPLHWKGQFTDQAGKKQYIGLQANCTQDNEAVSIWDGIIFDLNERVKLEEELDFNREQRAKQARLESLGELAAGLGHEINNPLTIIYGYLNQIKKNNPDENTHKVIDKCLQASDRIKDIVGDLKGLHPDHHVSQKIKDIHIDKLIEETVRIFQAAYKKENIILDYIAIDNHLWMQGDPAKVQQTLFHLISNAKKAVEESATKNITIKSKAIGSKFVSIEITDTGSGIKEDLRTKVYDAFFTTHLNRENKGLGLSLVSNIVQKHHGSIHFENNIDGKGVTFFLRFPLLKS